MEQNIHPLERALRIVIGLFLMSLAFWGPASMWFLLGIIPLSTGLIGWCPLYTMLGISTRKMNLQKKRHLKT